MLSQKGNRVDGDDRFSSLTLSFATAMIWDVSVTNLGFGSQSKVAIVYKKPWNLTCILDSQPRFCRPMTYKQTGEHSIHANPQIDGFTFVLIPLLEVIHA